MSSQSCEICGPKRISRALCNCCQQYLCRDHLQEHDDLLNAQVIPLVDNINQISDRLQQFDINFLFEPIRIQLDQWKQSAFQSIEHIYEQKSNQINQFINKQLKNLREQTEQTQKTIEKLVQQQDATHEQIDNLITKIQNIEKEINILENKSIEVDIHPLIIDDSYINFNIEQENDDDNNQLILTPIIQTIVSSSDNCNCVSSNDTYILLNRHSTLYLYDHNLNLIKESNPYSDLSIIDICWSSTINRFIILTNDDVFILNQIKMILEKSNIPSRTNGHWHNITSSSKTLYLTAYKWGTFIYQFNINLFQFEFNRRWQTPLTCNKDQSIDHFIHNNKNELAMIIQNKFNYNKYFQLKNDQTLECIWSYEINQCQMTIHRNRFCLIHQNQWLIINSNQSKLLYFNQNGLFKQIINYDFNQPICAIEIKQNFILVITNHSINLHQLLSNI